MNHSKTKPKGWLVFIVLLFIGACTTDNEPVFSERVVYGLVAKPGKQLKSIYLDEKKIMEFRYNANGQLAEMDEYYDDTLNTQFFSYNQTGQLIKWVNNYLQSHYVYADGLLTEQYMVNTNNVDWRPKYQFEYNPNGTIKRAEKYFNEVPDGYILYAYDERGNTTLRKEYAYAAPDDLLVSEYQLAYDENPNPVSVPGVYPLDILQRNNVVYHYFYSIYMSSFPMGQFVSYSYGSDGYPLEKVINIETVDWTKQPSGVYHYVYCE